MILVRLSNPDAGHILLKGHDIRTLRMYDLRQAMFVLFQDYYTHLLLSIWDNITLGDPTRFQLPRRRGVHAVQAISRSLFTPSFLGQVSFHPSPSPSRLLW